MSPRQGGDSYPSGTPPYGVPSDSSSSRPGQVPSAEQSGVPGGDEPRTETTLTTRIKINIPGSRPIPPVVVRSPLGEETGEQAAPRRHRADSSGSPVLGVMDSGQGTALPPDLPAEWRTPEPAKDGPSQNTSEWFAPRKKSAATPPPAAAPAPAQPAPAPAAQPAPAPTQQFQTLPQRPQQSKGAQQPAQQPQQPSAQQTQQTPFPQSQPQPQPQPQQRSAQQQSPLGYDTGTSAPWAGPGAQAASGPQTLAPRPVPNSTRPRGQEGFGSTSSTSGTMAGGPTGGRVGEQPGVVGGAPGAQPTMQFRTLTERQGADPRTAGAQPAGARPAAAQAAAGQTAEFPAMAGFGAAAPATAPAPGQPGAQPKQRKSKRPAQGATAGGRDSATEQTAAMPAFRPMADPNIRPVGDGFAGGTGGAGAAPRPEPLAGGEDGHGSGAGAPAASGSPVRKKGGGKVRKLAGAGIGAIVVLGGVAYGAGLMLNQADVPKGTTVLGQSIGGDTRDQAVTALDGSLGKLAAQPLQVSIGGRTTTLNPSVAGLTIDTGATVQIVAQHSYNPVTVIESLFGGDKAVAPVVVIDEDKLRSALQQLDGSSGGSTGQPYIRFSSTGKAEVVMPPKTGGTALDVNAAVPLVEQAFRARAAGRPDQPVQLPVTSVQGGSVNSAAADQAAQTLGAWAVKQHFEVIAGSAHVLFGKVTFSHALTLRPNASGQFVPVFNLTELRNAYGTGFDGAQLKNGGPVTPEAVAAALTALLSTPGGAVSASI